MLGWGTPAESGQVGEALSACRVHLCVHSQVFSSTAPSSSAACRPVWHCRFSNGLWLALSRCATGIRSAFPEPGLLRPRASLKVLMHGHLLQQHKTCGYSLYQVPSVPSAQSLLISPRSICPGCFQVHCSLLPVSFHLPSPFAWKRRGRGKCLMHFVLCHHGSSLCLPARIVLYWEWAGCWHD